MAVGGNEPIALLISPLRMPGDARFVRTLTTSSLVILLTVAGADRVI
jgi:hypothetical protein